MRSGEERRNLTYEQLRVIEGDDIERTRLQYRSHGEKNHGGGLKHRNVTTKVVEQHENVEKPERCVVRLYTKYISKCPRDCKKDEVFYLTPKKYVTLESNTYTNFLLGKIPFVMLLRIYVKMQKLEGTERTIRPLLPWDYQWVCQINYLSKEQSTLHTNQRVSAKEKESVSDVLQGNKSTFLEESERKEVNLEPEDEKSNAELPQSKCNVFNLSNCSVVFKM